MCFETFEKHGSRKYTKNCDSMNAFESVCEMPMKR